MAADRGRCASASPDGLKLGDPPASRIDRLLFLLFPVRDGSVVIEALFGSQALNNRQSSGDVSVVSNEWERTSEEEKGNKMYPFHPPAR